MEGKERFLCALARGAPGRPAVFLRDLTLGLDSTGFSTPEVCAGRYDADKAASSVIALHRDLRQDAVVGCIHFLGLEVEVLGGEMMFPERGIPGVVKHPFQGTGDPDLRYVDPNKDGPLPNVLACYRKVSERIGKEAAMVCNLEGPMTKAALLRGLENLALDIHLNPDIADSYVRYATDLGTEFLQAVDAKADIDCSFIAAASDNPDIFGRESVERYSLPNLAKLSKAAKGMGLPTVFHPHGDFTSAENLPLMEGVLGTGIEGFQFAERNDPLLLKERFSDRVCLLGGIETFTTLLLGPADKIRAETESFLRTFHPWNGYIFMCTCSLHRGMPMDHVKAMMDCVRSYPS